MAGEIEYVKIPTRYGIQTRRPGTYPYEHGREAARGERPSRNPYVRDSNPWRIWQEGHDDERDRQDAIKRNGGNHG